MSPREAMALDAWITRAPAFDPLGYELSDDELLAADEEFAAVCDERNDRAIEAMEAGAR